MIYYFFAFVCVACIAACIYMLGRVNRLEATLAGQQANVAKQILEQGALLAEVRSKLAKLELEAEIGDPDMERRIAERIEKKWDDGLQALLDFNPLTGGRGDDE